MSMNKFMHPRNIYKTPPDFKQLAINYPEFREFAIQDITGKITLNFKDLKSLRALSCVLLKKDFGLDVEMPLNKLIPTIPLRLNYILWIEDLLNVSGKSEGDPVRGIDIGTGASCVYPLIAAKKNGWQMLATEIDPESVKYAQENVNRNNLNNLIEIRLVSKDSLIKDLIDSDFDFCMCNPPFFSSAQELHPFFKSRKQSRTFPKNAFVAAENEVISKGGEVEFIRKLITESREIGPKITIYSTMVGHKCNLPAIKKDLRENNVFSFKETEFCQGNTTRWGLAWTFKEIDLKKAPEPSKQARSNKNKPSLKYLLPVSDASEESLIFVNDKLIQLFKELQMQVSNVTRNKNVLRYFISAFSNTWSHQRRKRRQERQKSLNSSGGSSEMDYLSQEMAQPDEEMQVVSPKRPADDEYDESLLKKLKITGENSEGEAVVFFKFVATLRNEMGCICLELDCDQDQGEKREMLHQILQYIKNNLKV